MKKQYATSPESVKRAFTLIELLVSATCQVCVFPLYSLKKIIKTTHPYARQGALHAFFANAKKALHTFTSSLNQRSR